MITSDAMAVLRLARDEDWNRGVVIAACIVVLLLCVGILSLANRVSKANREREGAMF